MGILLSLTMSLLVLAAPPAMARRYHYLPNDAPVSVAPGESAITWNNRGVDLYTSGKYAAAVSAYDKAIKMNPRYTDAYSNRGVAYDAMNQPERAVLDYSKAIQLNPAATASWVNRGLAYTDLARFNEAICDWNVVLKRNSRNSDAYYRRGFCYQSLGALDKALADYEKACKLNPRLAKAAKNRDTIRKALAIAPEKTNSAESAFTPLPMEKHIQPVAAVESGSKMAQPVEHADDVMVPVTAPAQSASARTPQSGLGTIGGTASTMNPIGGNASTMNPVRATRSSSVDAASYCVSVIRHVEGNFLSLVHQYDGAAASFSGAITMNPNDHFAYYRRANAYLANGKKDLALADYDAAVQLNPRFKQAKTMRDKLASEKAHR